jgi:hypothetical protein
MAAKSFSTLTEKFDLNRTGMEMKFELTVNTGFCQFGQKNTHLADCFQQITHTGCDISEIYL